VKHVTTTRSISIFGLLLSGSLYVFDIVVRNNFGAFVVFISLTFDDGNEMHYTVFYPILEKYGLRATFYVITSTINMRGKLSEEQIKDLYNHGNEIGSHTHTHPHLPKLPDDELQWELTKSKYILKTFKVETFAYPYGEFDDRVIKYVRKYYTSARAYHYGFSNFRLNTLNHRYRLKGINFEYCTLLNSSLSKFEYLIKSIIKNVEKKGWIILVFHGPSKLTLDNISWFIKNKRRDIFSTSLLSEIADRFVKPITDQRAYFQKFDLLCYHLSASPINVLPISEVIKTLRNHVKNRS
jgi:peptidoglycan/xylan/chitin deacetylase (PgdA/CDA1 family)